MTSRPRRSNANYGSPLVIQSTPDPPRLGSKRKIIILSSPEPSPLKKRPAKTSPLKRKLDEITVQTKPPKKSKTRDIAVGPDTPSQDDRQKEIAEIITDVFIDDVECPLCCIPRGVI
jgi:hypothetical protein